MSNKTILIIDDEPDIRSLIAHILQDEGYKTVQAGSDTQAFEQIENAAAPPDLVILDIWLEGSARDGMEILKAIKRDHPLLPVIMISGHGTIETAISALKEGAYDFLEKPFKTDRLLVMAQRALEASQLKQENIALKKAYSPASFEVIGSSKRYKQFENALRKVAKTNSRVFLQGPSGTGKTSAARFVHEHSSRASAPFTVLNCASLNPDHADIEILGAVKGALSPYPVTGLLEKSQGGTLLLDEVSDLPPATQAKILKVLQENRFQKIGAQDYIPLDVRFIATTHKDLSQDMALGRFRDDLYYCLHVVPIDVPPLRECLEDLPQFIDHFAQQIAHQMQKSAPNFTPESMAIMQAYDWPGNVRQLRNVLEWIMVMSEDNAAITPDFLPQEIHGAPQEEPQGQGARPLTAVQNNLPLKEARAAFEASYLSQQLNRFEGNIAKTAEFVGMERSALHRKIKQLNLRANSANIAS